MLESIPHALSLLALLAFALGASRLMRPEERAPLGARAAALACFAFLPPGSLPPWCNIALGGLVCLALFWLASAACALSPGNGAAPPVSGQRPKAVGRMRAMLPPLVLTCVCAVLAALAYERGLPGSLLNFGTYTSMPLWEGASLPLMLLLACLLLLLLALVPLTPAGLPRLAFCGMAVACLAPWNLSSVLGGPLLFVLGMDFFVFWLKVAAMLRLAKVSPLA